MIHYAPHYQAWIWATYLWLYDKTGYEPLLTRTRAAIEKMMLAYPHAWRWTNGIQQERGRMLLTLAWLIRVDDTARHREWLRRIAADMRACQHATGAIREELGPRGNGSFRPPRSNAEYGTNEASLIQANGDAAADLLYTCNFAFLGLHEAAAATGEKEYRDMAARLAEFLIRIQVKSDAHPELDGAWFRAFDFERWEYWGSNADHGWGAWSVEVGWTQAWIPTVLSMRELDVNLWELTARSGIARHWDNVRQVMLPESGFEGLVATTLRHAARGKKVSLKTPADPRYPGTGAATLTDGMLGSNDHVSGAWLGFQGESLDAVVDLGARVDIDSLGVRVLQSTGVGIFRPDSVELAVSDDGKAFEVVATIRPRLSVRRAGPLATTVRADRLRRRARYVRVRATNIGTIPAWHPAAGSKAWLFVDEIVVREK